MLSLSQILFTALVVVVVWQVSRFLSRKNARQNTRDTGNTSSSRSNSRRQNSQQPPAAQDMEKCPHCGVYHAEGLSHRCKD